MLGAELGWEVDLAQSLLFWRSCWFSISASFEGSYSGTHKGSPAGMILVSFQVESGMLQRLRDSFSESL